MLVQLCKFRKPNTRWHLLLARFRFRLEGALCLSWQPNSSAAEWLRASSYVRMKLHCCQSVMLCTSRSGLRLRAHGRQRFPLMRPSLQYMQGLLMSVSQGNMLEQEVLG